MTLEPGYDPIEHRDDGFSITVFFADLALAEWYVKNHNSKRWWDVMPKHEVFLDKVDFVMIDPDSSERFWPHLANRYGSTSVVRQLKVFIILHQVP